MVLNTDLSRYRYINICKNLYTHVLKTNRLSDTFSKCTNRDMKTSLLNAVVDFIPGEEVIISQI